MGDIVNLRRKRKQKSRLASEAKAEENRVKHGLSKAQRRESEAERAALARKIDAHRIEPGDGG